MMRKADVSFEELYNCYKVRFERFAISYIQDRSVAEDIVTDSFVYWWEHRDRVGSKDENPAAYILATVSIICVRYKFDCGVITRSENLKVVLCRRISGRWSFVIPSIFLLERLRLSFGKVWKNYRN